jgi:hypothetical protein
LHSNIDSSLNEEINELSRDTNELKISLLKIDTCLYKIIDRIIDIQQNCSSFKQGESCFDLCISEKSQNYRIYFASSSLKYEDYSNCFGIFEFRGIKFICKGQIIDELFHPSNTNPLIIKYPIKNKYQNGEGVDDSFSEWAYTYDKNKLSLVYERICEGYKKQIDIR